MKFLSIVTNLFPHVFAYLDLKNKGIDTNDKNSSKGTDVLNEQILEAVERHAKNSSKDLMQLMQINHKFVIRIGTVLTKRINEATYTAELKLLGLALLKELVQAPLIKRASRFRRRRKNPTSQNKRLGLPTSQQSAQNSQYAGEQIFCILNEKMIFEALRHATSSVDNNRSYFIYESLQIFNFLLTTMQKSQLLENEKEYLEFIEPLIDHSDIKLLEDAGLDQPFEEKPNEFNDDRKQMLKQIIDYESYKSFFKIVQQMKESNFRSKFQSILRITWLLVLRAQPIVQQTKIQELLNDSDNISLDDINFQELAINEANSPKQGGTNRARKESVISKQSDAIFKELQQTNQGLQKLFLIGFEILRHISSRISLDAEQDEYYINFLTPMFTYFESMNQSWKCVHFAKLVFYIIINNGIKSETTIDEGISKDWLATFQELMRDQNEQRSIRDTSKSSIHGSSMRKTESSVVDYTMLDFVLDFFMKHLLQGILPDKGSLKAPSENFSPKLNLKETETMLVTKKGLLEVMSECMKLLSTEMNIRQFDSFRYIDAIFQMVTFGSHLEHALDRSVQISLENQYRICIEIYLSKIRDVEQLLLILDYLMSSIQDEILAQNDNQMISRLNHKKIRGIVEILINPTLFFIKSIQDQEAQINGNIGIHSSNQQQEKTAKKQGGFKVRKIKENHIILLITLSKRCLEDGDFILTDIVLNTSISMSLISDDMMQLNQHKVKGMQKEFIQRHLNAMAEFIKADIESGSHKESEDFTCQMFSLWKSMLVSVDKKSGESLSVVYAFIVHLHGIITKGLYFKKVQELRSKILLHFILCSAATQFNVSPVLKALCTLKDKMAIDDSFWIMLPQVGNSKDTKSNESLATYTMKLENLLLEFASSSDSLLMKEGLKLNIEKVLDEKASLSKSQVHSPCLQQLLEESLEAQSQPSAMLKQKLETFKMNDQRGTMSHLQESTKKTPLLYDLNQKFLVESFSASLNEDSAESQREPAKERSDKHTSLLHLQPIPSSNGGPQIKLLPHNNQAYQSNKLQDSLNSEADIPQNAYSLETEQQIFPFNLNQDLKARLRNQPFDDLSERSSLSSDQPSHLNAALSKPSVVIQGSVTNNKFKQQYEMYSVDQHI